MGNLMITAQKSALRFQHFIRGELTNPILVVCDPPQLEAYRSQMPTSMDNLKRLAQAATPVGLGKPDFVFVGLCPPMPPEAADSASRRWKHVEPYVESLWEVIRRANPKAVVTLGELASRAVLGRAVAITKARGQAVEHQGVLVFPMLSPAFVNRVPEHQPTFNADMLTLAKIKENDFKPLEATTLDYRWETDIQFLLDNPPPMIGLDTETTGLTWYDPAVQIITVQISWARGKAVAVPVDPVYWPEWAGNLRARSKTIAQLKALLENPAVKKTGHNLKFDTQMLKNKLGIEVKGWTDDTQLLAFSLDENMMQKNLDECVRRWVPEMAGYADEFNREVDKSNMRAVPRDKMLTYSCGDADAALRLFHSLHDRLRRDGKQYNLYRRIMMPAIQAFATTIERFGMKVDQQRLGSFEAEVEQWVAEAYPALIQKVPPLVRRKQLAAGKELKFSRTEFVRDTLFSDPDGFKLEPVVFTKSTRNLPENEREPSTSAKDHLPYFSERDDAAGEFVRDLIDYQKTEKLLGTYIKGFWKYISPDGRIHPSYKLHGTNTGRTASDNPNGQNFPKRGRWAKAYQKIFQPTPGFRLVNCDLSQIELRIAAWMAMERRMLEIYRAGGDIHTATAKAVSRLTDAQWDALDRGERKALRTKAKACNFGFLYGMGWRKFMGYAKTDYGVTYTEREAQQTRDLFFQTYSGLPSWHERTREFAQRHGFVRGLHGAKRSLPSMFSNDPIVVSGAERQAINAPVQRFGSDLGLTALIRFTHCADPDLFRLTGFVHDALVLEVREGYEREGIGALLYAMESCPFEDWFGITPPLPIKADAEIGMNGGELFELAELPDRDKLPEWLVNLDPWTIGPEKPSWWQEIQIDTNPHHVEVYRA